MGNRKSKGKRKGGVMKVCKREYDHQPSSMKDCIIIHINALPLPAEGSFFYGYQQSLTHAT